MAKQIPLPRNTRNTRKNPTGGLQFPRAPCILWFLPGVAFGPELGESLERLATEPSAYRGLLQNSEPFLRNRS